MFAFLSKILQENRIDCFAPIPLSACKIVKSYLLEKEGIRSGTAVILAIPYYTSACADPARNISAYAVSRDYHRFLQQLFDSILPILRERYPEHRFAGFADHSPIEERDAAARAGLGVIGKNNLLLTAKYSSYIFIGEIITDAQISCQVGDIRFCENCGACRRACPAELCGGCLSALTQKKGALTEEEEKAILRFGSAWGCDICQEVCPHTKRAIQSGTIFSPIPFFQEQATPSLTTEMLDVMPDEEFALRAYSWRGRPTIRRNLQLLEDNQKERNPEC